MKLKQKSNKDSYEALKAQLKQDAEKLSYYFDISNRSLENLILVLTSIILKRKDLK